MEKSIAKKPVIYIVGPTASGKTALSVEVARHFGGEIISGDSMQIYKDMHIASAAPDLSEKKDVPHHLFEFLESDESYSVSRYISDAGAKINEIHSRGMLPFVVGGTGLYITSLAENIYFGEDDNKNVRLELEQKADEVGLEAMYEYLREIDPDICQKISKNDRKRILRAIEVYKISGISMSQRIKDSRKNPPVFENIFIGLGFKDRELLYDRINRRVDIMLENGLVDEAKKAFKNRGVTSAQAIGHKELFGYFEGTETLEQGIEKLKMQTRRYAKRQMTWFRKNENINWIYMDEDQNPVCTAIKIINKYLK